MPRLFRPSNELTLMWRNTRMVVLCAISAALYAAILVPFKVVPLIPGVTELRPANAIPIVCSFLFGPAGAWGSAIGNMIGDFFGGVGPGDIFGFLANLVYGYIPYKLWTLIADGQSPVARTPSIYLKYAGACLAAAVLCADIVGWGDNLLALRPFSLLGNVIILNNMLSALILSPLILAGVYPRVRAGRMLYQDVMPELEPRPRSAGWFGLILLLIGEGGAWIVGNLVSTGYWMPRFLPASFADPPYDRSIAVLVSPLILIALAGTWLM
jgi:energy-coupling factor transport system substrate-specific component